MLAHESNRSVDASSKGLLASVYVKDDEKEKIFLRVPTDLKDEWIRLCLEMGMKQNVAGEALVRWLIAQERDVQLAVAGVRDWSERERRAVRSVPMAAKAAAYEMKSRPGRRRPKGPDPDAGGK